jgi:membrane carboxypeptidase/penicillin-binding protein PbpC
MYGDNRDALVGRQHYILDQMASQNYITKQEAEAAKQVDTLKKIKPKKVGDIKAPHFVMYVKGILEEKYGVKRVEEGGLTVVTTLDWDKEQAAEEEVKKGVEARGKQYDFTNAALVSLDPKTGQILAMVGSKDYFDTSIDGNYNVTLSKRQPGSSFKPIVYAVGYMKGYLPETQLWDVVTDFKTDGRTYTPKNYSLKENGPISIRNALQQSLNIPAVKMLYLVGVGRVLDFAEDLGYTTFGERSRFGLSLVLGGGEVKPLEHAAAYAAFATEGVSYPTSAILTVKDANQQVLEQWQQPDGKRVMDEQVARLTSNVLSDNDARGAIFARTVLILPDRPVAAKTGTTNNFHDAWTAGYTPNLVTVVWVGNNDNHEMKTGADGSVVAAPIWQGYMKRATKDLPVEKFTTPLPPTTDKKALLGTAFQQTITVDKFSGKRATDQTPPEWKEDRVFYEAHDILYYVDKDDPSGPPPVNPASDPQFSSWEGAVQSWVMRTNWHTTNTPPLLYDDIHTADNVPKVTILSPVDNGLLSSRDVTLQSVIQAPRPILRLEASLNNTVIAVGNGSLTTWNLHIPNSFEPGYYELALAAIDDAGNHGQGKITINLTAPKDASPNILITSPIGGATWSRASFPMFAEIQLPNPALYRRVDVSFVGSDGERRLAASQADPDPNSTILHLNLPLGPPVGTYQLKVEAFQRDIGITDQASVPVIVTD